MDSTRSRGEPLAYRTAVGCCSPSVPRSPAVRKAVLPGVALWTYNGMHTKRESPKSQAMPNSTRWCIARSSIHVLIKQNRKHRTWRIVYTCVILARVALTFPPNFGTYLSTLMTQRVMMEAVQHITSIPINILQNTSPKSHLPPVRSVTITNGITTIATDRSATAKDTRR